MFSQKILFHSTKAACRFPLPIQHILTAHSTAPSKQRKLFPHCRRILVQWLFPNSAKRFLFIHLHSAPAVKILPKDIWVWPADIFLPTFSIQCDNILLPFVRSVCVLVRNNRMWGLNPTQSHVFCNAFSDLFELESLVRHPLPFWPHPSEGPYTEHPHSASHRPDAQHHDRRIRLPASSTKHNKEALRYLF